ncbi:MAG: hypothetical protein ACI97B_003951 [Verrucomicrobiales bacterium]|jgi:hypothetical protein
MHTLAYIDPGTGTLILQMLAATILGVTVVFRNIRYAIYDFFCKVTGKQPKERVDLSDEDEDEDDTEQ